jgi:hypothetical protein
MIREWATAFGVIALLVVLGRAVFAGSPEPQDQSWANQTDVLQLLIAILFGAFLWFSQKTLASIERSVAELSSSLAEHEARLHTIEVEHRIYSGHCRYRGPDAEDT